METINSVDLLEQIKKKKTFLCIGLDTDIDKIPKHLLECDDPVFEFNKQIVDATHHYAIAYKPNIAFYESRGSVGWLSLEKTASYIKDNYPEVFLIADVKKGDIGNTAVQQAIAYFETMPFDAVTVAPYMGEDSINPFLEHEGKWGVLLALTSNKSAEDFQKRRTALGDSETLGYPLYANVVVKSSNDWKLTNENNLMFVVGATNASDEIKFIRDLVPNHFLLVPGVGAQGGSLSEVAKYGMSDNCGLLVNSSRGIIYASDKEDFAEKAAQSARTTQDQMAYFLIEKGIIKE